MNRSSFPARFLSLAMLMTPAMFAVGCGRDPHAAEPDAQAEAVPVPVTAATVEMTSLRPAVDLVGTIVAPPERTASVSSQLGGWVEKVQVVDGQAVHAGDMLVVLDSHIAQINVDRARAMVAEKMAVLARLKRGSLPHELEVARQDRDRALAALEGLSGGVKALGELRARKEISEVHYETQVKAAKAAEAALASADAHLKLLEEGTPPEMIAEAQGILDVAAADLEQAELALRFCTITSPLDGVVVQLLARQGQYFASASPLLTVMDLSEIFVQLRVPGAEFTHIQAGTSVDVDVSSLPGRSFQGKVARVSGQADILTGNVDVFVAVANPDGLLRPGLSCHGRVWLPEIPDALAVPVAAVADHSGTAVVTLVRDGKAYETEVQLGVQTHELVQVVKGLSHGDVVITAGGYGLPEGCPVRIVPDAAAMKTAGL